MPRVKMIEAQTEEVLKPGYVITDNFAVTLCEGSRDCLVLPTGSRTHPWLYSDIPPGFTAACIGPNEFTMPRMFEAGS